MMSTMQHIHDDHSEPASHQEAQESKPNSHDLREHDHEHSDSTFSGLHHSSSSDSLSSTAEAVMELQPGRRLSAEMLAHSSSHPEEADIQTTSSLSSAQPTSKGFSQDSTRDNSHDHGQQSLRSADGHAKASDSDEDDMMAQLSRQPVSSSLTRQISPAPWPLPERGPVSLDDTDSDSHIDESTDKTLRVQGAALQPEQEASDNEADEEDEEQDEEADEAFIMSQLTKGLRNAPITDIQEEDSSDLEEMNEDLSDFDEDDMMAALTKER